MSERCWGWSESFIYLRFKWVGGRCFVVVVISSNLSILNKSLSVIASKSVTTHGNWNFAVQFSKSCHLTVVIIWVKVRNISWMLTMWQVILIIITSFKEGKLTSPLSADFPSSGLESEIFSAKGEAGGKKRKKNGGWVFFNDFLHIRIICHFN